MFFFRLPFAVVIDDLPVIVAQGVGLVPPVEGRGVDRLVEGRDHPGRQELVPGDGGLPGQPAPVKLADSPISD